SRSVTRVTLIISIPLLTLAVVAIVGSQRPHSVVASRLTGASVAFLQPRHAGLNDLTRLVDDAPPTPAPAASGKAAAPAPVAPRSTAVRPPPRAPAPPVSTVGGAAGVEFSLVNQDRAA